MSEDQELTAEDQALLAALAALEPGRGLPSSGPPAPGQPPAPREAAAAEKETLTRLYLETLGLVPFALPPLAPRPELKRRLLDVAAGSEASAAPAPAPTSAGAPALAGPPASASPAPVSAAPAGQFPPASSSPPVPAAPESAPAPAFTRASSPSSFSKPPRSSRPSSPSKWPLALAAALFLALLGACGWLLLGLRQQGAVVARLAAQRDAAQRHAGEAEARLGRLRSQVSSLRDSMAVVTSPAVEVCNLRPAAPEMGDARGVLFVAADHQHWTMSLRGVRPPGGGKVYQVWFVADQGMVSGGTIGGPLMELGSAHMPAGTRGVKITLEDAPGSPAPSGPEMLRNADSLHAL